MKMLVCGCLFSSSFVIESGNASPSVLSWCIDFIVSSSDVTKCAFLYVAMTVTAYCSQIEPMNMAMSVMSPCEQSTHNSHNKRPRHHHDSLRCFLMH